MNIYEAVITGPFRIFYEKVIQFLPNFITSIFILIVGIALGFLLKNILSWLFRAIGLDKASERSGAVELLKKGGVTEPFSKLLSRIIGWITVIIFAGISMSALQIPSVETLFERFLLYLPNMFIAFLIILFGYLLGNFFGRAALIASVNAGVRFSNLIGKVVKYLILILSATMALEQLGIGKETIVIAFAIIFGGIVLALAIAFGLGGRDLAKDYLDKKIKCEEKKDEINHL
ncbi:MAG: hypothetical protein HZA14_02175 [Nitrospirae bacterium]|nr:hypothetical protein [Nitrospirota bacterium]